MRCCLAGRTRPFTISYAIGHNAKRPQLPNPPPPILFLRRWRIAAPTHRRTHTAMLFGAECKRSATAECPAARQQRKRWRCGLAFTGELRSTLRRRPRPCYSDSRRTSHPKLLLCLTNNDSSQAPPPPWPSPTTSGSQRHHCTLLTTIPAVRTFNGETGARAEARLCARATRRGLGGGGGTIVANPHPKRVF